MKPIIFESEFLQSLSVLRFFLPVFHPPACHLHSSADHVASYGVNFYQSHGPSGQYTHESDGDEEFYVDLETKETVWQLPMFSRFISFDPQSALRNMAVGKHTLEFMMRQSNSTAATNGMCPPFHLLMVIAEILSSPISKITYSHVIQGNGHSVTEGVSETSFLSKSDHSFFKISYLTFLPSADEIYDCKVEHWGLDEPLLKHWEPEIPAPMSELTETLVCALGLSAGLMGIVVGTVFIIQGLHSVGASRHQGLL
uniref:Ig-like domain-containing protein n=1 Tax=Gorilla gorilla gorilla TaxID=9595 RepID=G3RCH0_GORGO